MEQGTETREREQTLTASERALNNIVTKLQLMHAVPRVSYFKHSKEGVTRINETMRRRTRTYEWVDFNGERVNVEIEMVQHMKYEPPEGMEGGETISWVAQKLILKGPVPGSKGHAVLHAELSFLNPASVKAFLALASGEAAFSFREID